MSPSAPTKVDLDTARETLLELLSQVQRLNGKALPNGRDRVAVQAPAQRELLYMAHLCDKAKVEIMETYHGLRSDKEA